MAHYKTTLLAFIFLHVIGLSHKVHCAQLYKYKDANGRWVFTDKKPITSDFQQEKLLVTEAAAKVAVVNRGTPRLPVLYGVSSMAGPVQVWLEFNKRVNIQLRPEERTAWIVDGPTEKYLANVVPIHDHLYWEYKWTTHFVPGKPLSASDIDLNPVMSPVVGGPFVISQSFHGTASHNRHASSYYAVDVQVPEGTPIRAVLPGKVMDVERDFSRSGWSDEYADEANFVRILHRDGTMAVYAHLKPESIQVSIGQQVRSKSIVGLSGNTGYSSGPHLHFAIQYNAGKSLKSLPFQFLNHGREPRAGDILEEAKP